MRKHMQQNMFFLDFMNNGLIIVWNRKYCEEWSLA